MGLIRNKQERELRALVRGKEIPHFPAVTLQILARLRDPDADFDKVAECVGWDPGLVLRILRTVNSAAYGVNAQIDNVRHAVTFVGRCQLEQLVLALAVKDTLPSTPTPGFDAGRFWRAAAFRAALARTFAHQLHPARNAEAFTAGLLQDMAIPVLAHTRPDEYGPILEAWHAGDGVDLHLLEQEAFGWGHARLGGMLGKAWRLPESLVGAIEQHHTDNVTDAEVLPATRLVSLVGEGEGQDELEELTERARSDGKLPLSARVRRG